MATETVGCLAPGPAYPLAISTWGDEERSAAIAVIESGRTTMGEKVEAFEESFARTVGGRYAVMSNSGSSANLLAVAAQFFTNPPRLRAAMVAVVPAISWATTYYPLSQYGLRLRFVDIDKETLNFDLAALKDAVDDDVAAIFAVNLLGNPNDYRRIEQIIGSRPIVLLEDNCEALGARFAGRCAGTFGRIGTFSTFFSHHISTMEGGVCVTEDEELFHIMRSLRTHGWTRSLPWPNSLVDAGKEGPFQEKFRFILPGYNLRPLEIAGAVGIEQLKKLPDLIAARRANADRFAAYFGQVPGLRIQRELGESSWFGFSIVLDESCRASRAEVIDALEAAGIETRPVVAGNFVRNPVIAHLDHDPPPSLRNADEIHERGFYLGNHHFDLDAHLARAREVIGAIIGA